MEGALVLVVAEDDGLLLVCVCVGGGGEGDRLMG